MNILCIGYYDKFSRFFILIYKSLKKNNTNINIKILSSYFSGFLYSLIRGYSSVWINYYAHVKVILKSKVYNEIILNTDFYKNVNYRKLISYNSKYNKSTPQDKFLKLALAYIDIYEEMICKFKPDLIISIGDSRIAVETLISVCKLHNIKIVYIEQGPFNSTILDFKGVNANASVIKKFKDFNNTTLKKTYSNNRKYLRSPIYRGIDFMLELLFNKTYLLPADLYVEGKRIKNKSNISVEEIKDYENCFFLPLQVPFDVNQIYHSPLYSSSLEIIKDVQRNLPKQKKLIVREHPVYKGKYKKEIYEFIKQSPNVFLDNESSYLELINKCKVIIVNNSTVGLEAMFKSKPIVLLGNAYYGIDKLCIKVSSKLELKNKLLESLEFDIDTKKLKRFKSFLYNSYLIPGKITDKKNTAAIEIARVIQSL